MAAITKTGLMKNCSNNYKNDQNEDQTSIDDRLHENNFKSRFTYMEGMTLIINTYKTSTAKKFLRKVSVQKLLFNQAPHNTKNSQIDVHLILSTIHLIKHLTLALFL